MYGGREVLFRIKKKDTGVVVLVEEEGSNWVLRERIEEGKSDGGVWAEKGRGCNGCEG